MASIRKTAFGITSALMLLPLGACMGDGYDRPGRYAAAPGEPYYADQYYREGPNYRERRLSRNDRVYQGRDGRYYCKRDDGTTGLIIGGIAGGVLGNLIAPGGSNTLGTLLGAAAGAAAGSAIDKNEDRDNVRCR
jgi:hypothetical protein